MPFTLEPIAGSVTADGILAWCGVSDNPTPAQILIADLAAVTAEDAIRFYRHTTTLEVEYQSLAIEIGVYLYSKRGVDGVLSFSENGVARSFEAGSIPPSMLARIRLPITAGVS
jgi:hypothetical protein